MRTIDGDVLAFLRAHPHDDTIPQIVDALPGADVDPDAVAEALERLRGHGLVCTAGGHWQLTAAGFRLHRAA